MYLQPENVSELWQAHKDLRIPDNAVAYHFRTGKQYGSGEGLKRADRDGELVVCRTQFKLQLREVAVMLRRGDAGPCAHIAWCSLNCVVSDVPEFARRVGRSQLPLTFRNLEDALKTSVADALQDFEDSDLTQSAARRNVASQLTDRLSVLPGLRIEKCSLRRVLVAQEYRDEQRAWAEFQRDLIRLMNDQEVWQSAEKDRLEQELDRFEKKRRIRSLLTDSEATCAAKDRFATYVELLEVFQLPQPVTAGRPSRPCPHPQCRADLSAGQTFVCARCRNEVHAWHRSAEKPTICDRCHRAITRRRKSIARFAAVVVAAVAGLSWAYFGGGLRDEVPALGLHWHGFGERFEDDEWREFRVQDGMTMYSWDQFRIVFIPSADCYVRILCLNADGTVTQLFPDPILAKQSSFCHGGREYVVPNGLEWFVLDERTGTESLFLVASHDPLNTLRDLAQQDLYKAPSPAVGSGVLQEITALRIQNQPDSQGIIRTRTGKRVRNVIKQTDQKLAHAVLSSGQNVTRVMDFAQGQATVVERIQFMHVSRTKPPAAPVEIGDGNATPDSP